MDSVDNKEQLYTEIINWLIADSNVSMKFLLF